MTAQLSSPFGEEPTYWRRTLAGHATHYRLEASRDWRLVDGAWISANQYKSGPTWWRLTGETDVDQIPFDDLPPRTPR